MTDLSQSSAEPVEVKVRPDAARIRRQLLAAAPVLAVGTLVVALSLALPGRHSLGLGWWGVAVTLGAVLLLSAGTWLAIRNLALCAGPGHLTTVDWLGRRRTVPRDEIVALVRCSVVSQSVRPKVVLVGHGDRGLGMVDTLPWEEADLARVWARLGVEPRGSYQDAMTPVELRERFPDVVSWPRAHPRLVGALIGIALAAGAVVLVLVGRG